VISRPTPFSLIKKWVGIDKHYWVSMVTSKSLGDIIMERKACNLLVDKRT
jgi:hypothetical protein